MCSSDIFNAAFWVDQFGLMGRQEAGNFLQDGIEELIFGNSLDDLAFAENNTLPFSASQANIGITRLARAIYYTAHYGNVNGGLHLCQTFLNFISHADHVDFYTSTGGA